MAIRVALVSAEPILVYGLEHLFRGEADLQLSVFCRRASDAMAILEREMPQVLLLDVALDDEHDLAALRQIASLAEPPPTVVLVPSVEPEELLEILALGVRGVLVKEMAPRLFVECVRKVARGERWVELRSEALALEHMVRREAALRDLSRRLTARELELMPLVTKGLSNKEIAARLGIASSTVKLHLKHLYRKLGVDSRVALVRWAEARGLHRPTVSR